jgi:predicted acylesterase/phospholipase RssA
MDAAIPVQLCLQGGAAKIPFLAAFVEAIEELHNSGEIRITNVAGTSAGAIIGTLFAARVPMSSVRTHFAQAPLDRIVPSRWWITVAWKLMRGQPLCDEEHLRTFLAGLLGCSELLRSNPPKKLDTFDDIFTHCRIRVRIMATNLTDGTPDVKEGRDPLVNSMLDSAALPFAFRAAKSPNGTIVDGGLSENLPSELLSDDENDGPIIAASFARTAGSPPVKVRDYFMAVVGAGIDQGVDRARARLEERARVAELLHEVYPITPPFQSFDFDKALTEGLQGEYEKLRDNARAWLKEFVQKRRAQIRAKEDRKGLAAVAIRQASDERAFFEREMPKNLARIYKTQYEPIKLRWTRSRLAVTVGATDGDPDGVNHSTEFHTLGQPIWCHRLPILAAPQSHAVLKSGWKLYDPQRRVVPYFHMLMEADGDPPVVGLMICFETPLPPNTGPYRIALVEQVPDFMIKLRKKEKDDLWVSFHRRHGPVDRIEVIAHVPTSLGKIRMEPMAGAQSFSPIDDFELSPSQPAGYESFGMFGVNVDSDSGARTSSECSLQASPC